jgi:hypothetical protein
LVAAAIPEHARDKPIELWWQDEARVGQQGSLTYIWADKGSRPRAPRDQRYAWAYIFGAVCPARGIGAALVLPIVSTETMNLHLAEISTNVAVGGHAVVTLDGAGVASAGRQTQATSKQQSAAITAISSRAQPSRKRLAVPQTELPRQPRLRKL